jgi:hypothetical protein
MRMSSVQVLVCGALIAGLAACSAATSEEPGGVAPDKSSGGSPGKGGQAAQGGSTASGGSTGAGGSVVTPPAGTGGSPSSSGGSAGGSTPTGSGGASGTPDAAAADASSPPTADASAPPSSEGAPYGCTKCTRLFNGKDLEGWETVAGAWEVKDGVLASTGKPNDIYTKEDFGDYRIFFQIKQVKGNHKPCTTLFGTRPAPGQAPKRGLGGAQFQPPNGSSWNYGIGGKFTGHPHPAFDVTKWHQCEVVVKEAGSFRAACCPMGPTPCKGIEVLSWTGPSKKAPFNIMMHNPGLFDEFKEIWIEKNQTEDGFLSQK